MGSRIYLESRAGRVGLAPGAALDIGRFPDNDVLLESPRA